MSKDYDEFLEDLLGPDDGNFWSDEFDWNGTDVTAEDFRRYFEPFINKCRATSKITHFNAGLRQITANKSDDFLTVLRQIDALRNASDSTVDVEFPLFHMRLMQWFIAHRFIGIEIDSWALDAIANKFFFVQLGDKWSEQFRLPIDAFGAPSEPFPKKVLRDAKIYEDIKKQIAEDKKKVTDAIASVAVEYKVSFETARAAYYFQKSRRSKKKDGEEGGKILKMPPQK